MQTEDKKKVTAEICGRICGASSRHGSHWVMQCLNQTHQILRKYCGHNEGIVVCQISDQPVESRRVRVTFVGFDNSTKEMVEKVLSEQFEVEILSE